MKNLLLNGPQGDQEQEVTVLDSLTQLENSKESELRAYIYQQLAEFQPYVTAETVIEVIADDSAEWLERQLQNGEAVDRDGIKGKFLIRIVLIDGGSKLQGTGVATDVYSAIRVSKENLLKLLIDIQEKVISTKDRLMEIHEIVNKIPTQLH